MSNLSGVRNTISDGALGTVPASSENEMVLFGVCSAGTANKLYTFTDKNSLVRQLGRGPLVQAAAYLLGTSPVKVVPVSCNVPGDAGSVTQTGSGPTLTIEPSTPNDAYDFVVKITKAGNPGVGEFRYSLDGGDTYSIVIQIPIGMSYPVPGTNMTLEFDANNYHMNTTYEWKCTAPYYTLTNLAAAIDAYLATTGQASLFFVVGTPAGAEETADLITAIQIKLDAAQNTKRYIRAIVEAANVDDEQLLAATRNTDAKRVVCCAGTCELYSDIDSVYYTRSSAWPVAQRTLGTKCHTHIGRVGDGTLVGIRSLNRDERVTPNLGNDIARFCVLLTRVDKPGFFVEDDFTMASQGSDYSQLRNGRVIDKTLRIADQFLVDLVHSDYALAPDGTLAEHEAMRIQNYVEQALRNGIVAAGNATNVEFRLNRFENIASTRTLRCTTRVQVRASAKWIEHDIAFASTLGQ